MWKSVRNVLASSCAFVLFGTVGPDDCTPGPGSPDAGVPDAAPVTEPAIKPFFVTLLENQNWSTVKGSSSAPYIRSLLPQASHAEAYKTPTSNHPSEPNYLWLVGGTNFGVTSDADPATNHIASDANLGF